MATPTDMATCFQRLPTEFLLNIIEFIPVEHILPFRTVSRWVQTHIDTRVLLSYIRRIKLHGPLSSLGQAIFDALNPEDAACLSNITASFSHLQNAKSDARRPVWESTYAVLRIDPMWLETHRHVAHMLDPIPPSSDVFFHWCIQLDHTAQALEFSGETDVTTYAQRVDIYSKGFHVDIDAWTVRIDWRKMLWPLLKKEVHVRREAHKRRLGNKYCIGRMLGYAAHYPLGECCLRAIRREAQSRRRYVSDLLAQRIHELHVPLQDGQCPVYGPMTYAQTRLKRLEDDATRAVMRLRRCWSLEELENLGNSESWNVVGGWMDGDTTRVRTLARRIAIVGP